MRQQLGIRLKIARNSFHFLRSGVQSANIISSLRWRSSIPLNRFYKQLILRSDARFDDHLKKLKGEGRR